ncbi:mitochondrial inner membrane protein required for protein import [Spathaspora passalidarum NRRL Y-27907]|uniref:Mitochondrial import inner membrane translocase subunit TIM50 n=1 Tax=Spathaspora passalidarum (strain NRRL Y-27907 / 11-Y1) TaxID=619300 RepID=G3AGB0_SPAPN|nr:mitochondrial inner membrane protein required for protein import [Spathaspora passalidarum NRRL Y-27907]EGW35249.1 mitochondrial inner membrane protein required for protein import [Spathaspora passalidarum NRRL Y-27907]
MYLSKVLASAVVRTSAVRAVAASKRPALFMRNTVAWYSSKSDNTTKKDEQPPQSILTEDLLARAGFEDPDQAKAEAQGGIEGEGKSTDEAKRPRKRKRAQSSKDRQRERYANLFYLSTFVGGIAGLGYMSRDWDSEKEQEEMDGKDIGNGYTPGLMYERMSKRLGSLFTFFSEPAFENLLPPPPPEAYRRPLTLVLTLDDLLVHSSWDTQHGWRTAKRPGLDYFLGYLSQYYEIVVFATNSQMFSEKTVGKLDPYHAYISYALFREACRYKDGKLIKDLSLLNRDLGKTVIIDVDEDAVSLQPENGIVVEKWDGKADDYLISMIPFLEYLATQPVKDVRPILKTFTDKSKIVDEFAERERKLREQWNKDHKHSNQPNAGNFLAKLMGMPTALTKEPKMPLDIIREHGQLQYEHFQKYLRENAHKFLEEEQKLKDEFGKVTLNKLITEGAPSPEEIAKVQAERAKEEANKQK